MNFETVVVGALETNCYLIFCEETSECVIVDPGAEKEKIVPLIFEKGLKPIFLINTHGHIDHTGANADIKEKYEVPFLIHEADATMLNSNLQSEIGFYLGAQASPPPDGFLEHDQIVSVGQSSLKVIHTPGHSPGSVSLLGDGFLLTGDSLFFGGVGRTDLPGGSWDELEISIREKILVFPDTTVVLPGHGPQTTVGEEKRSNPFIR